MVPCPARAPPVETKRKAIAVTWPGRETRHPVAKTLQFGFRCRENAAGFLKSIAPWSPPLARLQTLSGRAAPPQFFIVSVSAPSAAGRCPDRSAQIVSLDPTYRRRDALHLPRFRDIPRSGKEFSTGTATPTAIPGRPGSRGGLRASDHPGFDRASRMRRSLAPRKRASRPSPISSSD